VQIHRVVELAHPVKRRRGKPGQTQAGRDLHLVHADTCLRQPGDACARIFELDRRMAQIKANAEMIA
jgi:hypothetical protein